MLGFCSRYIQDYATLTEPLPALTKKHATWTWTDEHRQAITKLKRRLTASPVMSYFDPRKSTELIVDASPVGLAAILAQSDAKGEGPSRVIAYASKALTEVEQRYSQIEREALAIVWGCEHFHFYLHGAPFTLVTDHRPLEAIFGKPLSRPSARIERWALRLQPYDFNIIYRAGKDNPADYMSRHPLPSTHTRQAESAEAFVSLITTHATLQAMTLEDIRSATAKDARLQRVIQCIKSGKWYDLDKDMQPFFQVRSELCTTQDQAIVLRGSRIVIPDALQTTILNLAHEGHQGLVKTKRLLRETVWFPNIDAQAAQLVATCIPCQANTPQHNAEPLNMSDLPSAPWVEVSMDFCGPYPTGDYLMVLIDEYSRFPIVELIRSTAATTVIPHLESIFGLFGIPGVLKTDNGSPFNGQDFAVFTRAAGIRHRKITPLWPQANAMAERFMRTLSKAVKASILTTGKWKREIATLLRNYRATPHSTTGTSPAELMFGRKIRTKLPQRPSQPRSDDHVRRRDEAQKAKMKQLGTMVTVENKNNKVTRNSSYFKKLPPEDQDPGFESDTDDDSLLLSSGPVEDQPQEPDIRNRPRPQITRRYPRRNRRPPRRLIDE